MRRLTRLRPASWLLRPHRPTPCASRCYAAAHINSSPSFSTSRPRPAKRDVADATPLETPVAAQNTPPAQPADRASAERAAATAAAEAEATPAEEVPTEPTEPDEPALPERLATKMARRPRRGAAQVIETDLVLPPPPEWAPLPKDVVYTPAITGDGLEMVGGLDGWWDQEGHWSGRLGFSPFFAGGAAKVTDAAALEAVVRRAVVEALAVRAAVGLTKERHGEANVTLTGRWAVGGREAAVRALGVALEVAEDGKARLAHEPPADLVADLAVKAEAAPAEEETAGTVPTEDTAEFSAVDAGEAAALVETWDPSWKTMSLDDITLKFAVRGLYDGYICLPAYTRENKD